MRSAVPAKKREQPPSAPSTPDVPGTSSNFSLPSPTLSLIVITVAIFLLEIVAMKLSDNVAHKSILLTAAIDATLLIALLSPVLYFLLFRPLSRQLQMREQAEQKLKQSRDVQLQDMLRTSLDGYWMSDAQGNFLEVNDAYCRMSGYSREELLGMCISDVEAIEKPEDTAAHLQQLMETGSVNFETRHRRRDGEVLDIEVSANFVKYLEPRIHCFLRNITMRKRAEEALRLQSEITANAAEGIALIKAADSTIHYANRRFESLLGYAPGELIGRHISIINAPTDKCAQETADEIQRQVETHGEYSGELLNLRKDGTTLWTSFHISSVPHPQLGKLWVTYQTDISARKRSEEALQLAAMVYENSSEAIAVTDANNCIVAVNPAFEKMTGYTTDDALGKNPSFMSSGRHGKEFYQNMWQEIASQGHWQGEMWDRRKNGEIYAKSLAINVIRNQDGSVYRHVALFSDITERKQSEELIWKQANFDPLTELPNRRMFLDRLQQDIKKAERSKLPVALLLIDLDQFKEVNDTLGHAAGDALLKEAAFRIRACVRTSDTVARLGGDEFTVILPEIAELANVEDIAQKIIGKLCEYFVIGHETVYVSASVGITLHPNDARNIEDMLKNADQAMYEAKHMGRNRFSYFTHSLQEHAQKRLRTINDLRAALPEQQLQLHFQPIINLATGRINKVEALLRWQHPQRGMVSPAEFIPLAEESGLIHEIGDWVFRESARWVQRWRQKFDTEFQVSINKSPVQFKAENYSSGWLDYLHELQVPGQHIVVEITEGLLLNAEASVSDKLLAFRDAGIQVAIDDFGTGYSSLSYLKKFDIDYLKIDQSFVRNLGMDSSDLALCEAIIVMAHKLGLKVIAEGVETEAQRAMLAAAGCDFVQGYLLSRPLPAEQLEQFLLQRSPPR